MKNFGQIIFLPMLMCITAKVLVYCQDDVDVGKYPFDVVENEAEVEKRVIKYINKVLKPPTKIRKVLQTVADFIDYITCYTDPKCEVDPLESFNVDDVCELNVKNKLFLCSGILRLNYFGLQFDDEENAQMSCDRRKISLRHHSTDKLATDEVPMYQCPQLKYISLTTDEPIFLLVKHFISSSHEPDTFVLYIQQDAVEEHQIYPYKFANFSPMMLHPTSIIDEKEDQSTAGEMSFYGDARVAKNQISEFIEIIKLPNVYEKFRSLYKTQNICGLPSRYKIAVCRYVARRLGWSVDYRGYDEFKCRERQVFSTPPTPEDEHGDFMGSLHAVKCPALYEVKENEKRYIFKTMFLTSSQWYQPAFYMLQRLNLRQREIKPEAVTFSVKLQMLQKDRRRIREYNYLKSDKSRTVATSSVPTNPLLIIFNRSWIENNVISFVQMKQEQRPYERFIQSYNSININMWSGKEMNHLCYIILKEEPYNMIFETVFDTSEYRSRVYIDAELLMRDAELLPDKEISARRCSPSLNSSSTFFVVATLRINAVILYVKYENELYSLPHSYVYGIDSTKIKDEVNKKQTFPSLL